jgi:hypothetical protein
MIASARRFFLWELASVIYNLSSALAFHGAIYRRHFSTEGASHPQSARARILQPCAEHRALLQAAHERTAQSVRTHIEKSNACIIGLLRADLNG